MAREEGRTIDLRRLLTDLDIRAIQSALSQKELSAAIGIPSSTISRMRSGTLPDLVSFARMVAWLGGGADHYLNIPASTTCERCVTRARLITQAIDILKGGSL